MITKTTKYETPQGLEENQYYDLMYEFVDLAKIKGLTIRQAQKLFTDCADMVLDVKPTNEPIGTDYEKNIVKHLESIAYSLDYFVFNDKRTIDKSHSIPD